MMTGLTALPHGIGSALVGFYWGFEKLPQHSAFLICFSA